MTVKVLPITAHRAPLAFHIYECLVTEKHRIYFAYVGQRGRTYPYALNQCVYPAIIVFPITADKINHNVSLTAEELVLKKPRDVYITNVIAVNVSVHPNGSAQMQSLLSEFNAWYATPVNKRFFQQSDLRWTMKERYSLASFSFMGTNELYTCDSRGFKRVGIKTLSVLQGVFITYQTSRHSDGDSRIETNIVEDFPFYYRYSPKPSTYHDSAHAPVQGIVVDVSISHIASKELRDQFDRFGATYIVSDAAAAEELALTLAQLPVSEWKSLASYYKNCCPAVSDDELRDIQLRTFGFIPNPV